REGAGRAALRRRPTMAWWRERVVAPVRRAWLAVARRARNRSKCGYLSAQQTNLHRFCNELSLNFRFGFFYL
uniref:Uncharacterized protein n=1 Tax=Aegilops tauschii subsp. strangulata TaxID=200361 RepID=A0A453NK11_AEGTS